MKITEAELNRKIAELRGWTQTKAGFCGQTRKCWLHPEHRISWDAPPAFSSDMNLAMQLANEFSCATLHLYGDGFGFFASDDNKEWQTDTYYKTNPATAICLAWLQWKTGEVYEVIEDGE